MVAHNDIHGAIDGMRQRYISVAVEIADALTVLAKSAAGAPPKTRKTALAAIARIAAAQEKLSGETRRLPAAPVERLALMQSALQAQQGALVQLALIVKQLGVPADRSERNQLSRFQQRERPSSAHLPNSDLARAVLVSRRIHSDELRPFTNQRLDRGAYLRPPTRSKARAGGGSARSKQSAGRSAPVLLLKAVASRSLILVTIIASGLLVAYGSFPRASNVPEPSAKGNEVQTRSLEAAIPKPVARTEPAKNQARQTLPSVLSPGANTQQAVLVPVSPGVLLAPISTTKEAAAPAVVTVSTPSDEPRSASRPLSIKPPDPSTSEARNDPSPAVMPGKQEQPAQKIETVAAIPTPSGPKEGFVAVLFTHKELATVKSAFSHLQHSFPTLLQRRTSEIQAVDMGEKGVWHRLVLLPAGSREQAQTVCQGLMAAGYDRCWVKAY